MFGSPEQMQEKIDAYFVEMEEKDKHPTVSGLCYYIGFSDRHSLSEYAEFPEFTATVKRARIRIEEHLEQCLFGNNVTGVIFNLKNNFEWKDKHEVDSNNKITVTIDDDDSGTL